jgi:hypothetical protein
MNVASHSVDFDTPYQNWQPRLSQLGSRGMPAHEEDEIIEDLERLTEQRRRYGEAEAQALDAQALKAWGEPIPLRRTDDGGAVVKLTPVRNSHSTCCALFRTHMSRNIASMRKLVLLVAMARIGLNPLSHSKILRWACVLGVSALVGCTLPRRDAPPAFFSSATPVGFPADVRFLSTDRASVEAESTAALQRLRASSKNGVLHALVLSGGGAGGAFGAGALVGLSRLHERPQFDVVTGVSAGALIAPFAFLGPEWDSKLTEAFTSGRGERMSLRGLLQVPFGAKRRSAVLTALVDHYVTGELIQAVAREAASGRLLWVATTDLDKEETVIWDMGVIAARGDEPARKLFRDVLVASASVPGLFSPVLIHVEDAGVSYEEMHVDGNASTSLFVAPDAAYFALLDPRNLDGARVYVLMNGQIIGAPQTTRFQLGRIVSRSFSAALKHMSRTQVITVSQFAEKYRMSVQWTYVPFDYPTYSSADFRASTMRTLFDYGARCAEAGRLWTTIDQTMAAVAAPPLPSKRSPPTDEKPQCPLRDVQLPSASSR